MTTTPSPIKAWIKYHGTPDNTAWLEDVNKHRGVPYCDEFSHMTRQEFVLMVVNYFNMTLRPGERPRELVRLEENES